MALFSKEYYDITNQKMIPDFSIIEEFNNLKENEHIDIICEGFGITQILKRKNQCYVNYRNNIVFYPDFIDLLK